MVSPIQRHNQLVSTHETSRKWVAQSCLTLWPHGLYSLPDSSVHGIFQTKNNGVGSHSLLQQIFPTQDWNPGSPTLQVDSLVSKPPGKPSRGKPAGGASNPREDYLSVHSCLLSHFSRVRLFPAVWAVAHQAPLSTGFSRQEHWSE